MNRFSLLCAIPLLSACITTTAPKAEEPSQCAAASLQYLVGQSADMLQTIRFASTVRILHPDTIATADFDPSRANIRINEANQITAITCG